MVSRFKIRKKGLYCLILCLQGCQENISPPPASPPSYEEAIAPPSYEQATQPPPASETSSAPPSYDKGVAAQRGPKEAGLEPPPVASGEGLALKKEELAADFPPPSYNEEVPATSRSSKEPEKVPPVLEPASFVQTETLQSASPKPVSPPPSPPPPVSGGSVRALSTKVLINFESFARNFYILEKAKEQNQKIRRIESIGFRFASGNFKEDNSSFTISYPEDTSIIQWQDDGRADTDGTDKSKPFLRNNQPYLNGQESKLVPLKAGSEIVFSLYDIAVGSCYKTFGQDSDSKEDLTEVKRDYTFRIPVVTSPSSAKGCGVVLENTKGTLDRLMIVPRGRVGNPQNVSVEQIRKGIEDASVNIQEIIQNKQPIPIYVRSILVKQRYRKNKSSEPSNFNECEIFSDFLQKKMNQK